ncbi:MAG: PAS domain S-box protein, partial [Bacteroidota bacterium]|nr:PAS domain S-box protein [Bacteroidota bacterium]
MLSYATSANSHYLHSFYFDSYPLPGLIVDTSTLKIVSVNRAAVLLYGYSRDEFLALHLADLQAPAENVKEAQWLQHIADTGCRHTVKHFTKTGHPVTIELLAALLPSDHNNLYQITIVGVTERSAFSPVVPAIDSIPHQFTKQLSQASKLQHKLFDDSSNLVAQSHNNHLITDNMFEDRIGNHVTTIDIKWQEDQLQYQAILMDNVSDIIVTTDNAFRIKSFNKAAELCYGYEEKEVLGKFISNIVQFKYPYNTIEDALAELKQKGIWKGEVSFINKQGELRYFLHTVKFVHDKEGNTIGVMSIGRDIAERKQTEEKLKQSELFYPNLIAKALDGILLTDAQGNINFTSLSVKHILGYEAEEVIGKNCFQFVHPEDQAYAADSFQREVIEDPEIKFIVIRLLKKDGDWLWCMVRGHNLLHNSHVQGIVIYFHDDTLRKKATDALRESEQRFRNLVRNLQFGVVMQNSEGKVMMCNEALLQIFQLTEEEIKGRSLLDALDNAIHEDGTAVTYEELPLIKVISTKKPVRNVVMGIYHTRFKERKWILVNSDPFLGENNGLLYVICSIKDISERKKLEQKLVQEQMARHRLLTQATIDGQEKERREIGKELHDNIGQQLTTTKLYLDLARSTADSRTAEMISSALKNISAVINEVRSISSA